MSPGYSAIRDHLIEQLLRHGGGATYQQLLSWGAERWTVPRLCRDGVLVRIERGYFVMPWGGSHDHPWRRLRSEHLRAVAALTGGGTYAGLRSGALAWGLPVSAIPQRPEVLRPPATGYLRGARVVRRQVPLEQTALLAGVPVTSLVRTAVDIALDLPTPKALVTVDAVLRRGTTRRELLGVLSSLGGARGVRRARKTIEWADARSESALESAGRGELLVRGAPRPWCNVSFRLDETEFRVDHWWPTLRLVGEADGALKYSADIGGTSLWQEKLRQEWLEDQLGLTVIRYLDKEVRLAPGELFTRWQVKAAKASQQVWTPPPALEVFQRPPPGSGRPWSWLLRRDDLGAVNST